MIEFKNVSCFNTLTILRRYKEAPMSESLNKKSGLS